MPMLKTVLKRVFIISSAQASLTSERLRRQSQLIGLMRLKNTTGPGAGDDAKYDIGE